MAAPNIVAASIYELNGFSVISTAITAAEVAANTSAEQTFTVTGLKAGDFIVNINKPTAQAGLGIVGARVTAADTIGITYMNTTAAGITPTAAETHLIGVFRPVATKTAFEG